MAGRVCCCLALTWPLLGCGLAQQAGPQPSVLVADQHLALRIAPATLAASIEHVRGASETVSTPVTGLGPVSDLTAGREHASWRLPEAGLDVKVTVVGGRVHVSFVRAAPGRLTWPLIRSGRETKGFVIPALEGVYVRADDPVLGRWLVSQGEMGATESLSMPFIGVDCGACALTYIVATPYYAALTFTGATRPAATFSYTWTRLCRGTPYEVIVEPSGPGPLSPALAYRRWLTETGQLVTLKAKIARNPDVERLLGAPHAYLWGDEYLSALDVPRERWRPFAAALLQQARAGAGCFAARLLARLSPDGRTALHSLADSQWPDRYSTGLAASALSAAITDPALSSAPGDATAAEAAAHNARELAAVLPGTLPAPDTWGNGISTALLEALHNAGVERAVLCTSDLDSARLKPQVAARARQLGFLFAPYDSYGSIHDPNAAAEKTWTTARFDRRLYESGGIVRADGTPVLGFQKRGYALSPLAARPYVHQRVEERLRAVPYSAWFVDCDAFGTFYEDYRPGHTATRLQDAEARRERLLWLSSEHGLVVGSEGGSAVMTPAIAFAHGVMTPVLGWGDKRLTDPASEFFSGRWWPPDEPEVFFRPVKLPADYERPYFSPADCLPLYQAVFGDCVIATHHWSSASLKFADHAGTVELMELLYDVPPLYHLNRQRWAQDAKRIVDHVRFWSPVHRVLALAPLVDFAYVTEDRLVQRTTWQTETGPVHLVANFGRVERALTHGRHLPPRSLTVDGPLVTRQRVFVVHD